MASHMSGDITLQESKTAETAMSSTDLYPIRRGYTFAGFEPSLHPIKQIEDYFFRAHTQVSESGKVRIKRTNEDINPLELSGYYDDGNIVMC